MIEVLLVGLGGSCGAISRYLVGRSVESTFTTTLTVNVTGSFLLGGLVVTSLGEPLMLALGVGFCGALTTFSSFAVDTVSLLENGRCGLAVGYAVGMVALAIAAIFVGGVVATLVA